MQAPGAIFDHMDFIYVVQLIRLFRMPEMWTSAIDGRVAWASVNQSVLSRGFMRPRCANTAGRIEVLFGGNDSRKTGKHGIRQGSRPTTSRGRIIRCGHRQVTLPTC